ncbi:uncharacterized protein LOC124646257 [Helicoverpa zea]|uniref:uncharacterized protein LOC124637100 n=1 Tax=Helicoverpa zea TaxID=7113 RepID=UPI001F5A0C67|nr:uncharacterized protein LOC124637100 [Helicoverpa zea]XP_047034361.1 uncharacterized protein LOC124640584 [Helicoverpa zea]XP_047042329.1 uncharacterized protein LOC124646257 [Helicoverpa zea]
MDLYTQLASSMEELSNTFTSRMAAYEEELKNVSSNEASHKTIASLSRDYTDFKCLVWKTMSALKLQMELLTLGLDRHEMASRRHVLLLHGLPEKKDEEYVSQAVIVLTEKLKMSNISAADIASCHRLGTETGKPRPLLIRFQSLSLRSEVWQSKTMLKGSGLVFSEFLTKPRHDAFLAARKHFGVKQCWTSEGKIVVLLPDKSRRKIESPAELQQLTRQFPTLATSASEPTLGARESPLSNKSPTGKRSKRHAK